MHKSSIAIQGNAAKPLVMRSPYLDDVFPSIQDEIINQMASKINKQKEDLIKSKIIEKGFEHLIEGIEKRRFPKILCEKREGMSVYFADDDTEKGCFIVAIQDLQLTPFVEFDRDCKVNTYFKYTDDYKLFEGVQR